MTEEKNENPQHSPQHEDLLKKQALEQQEVKEVLVFLQKYAKPVVIVLAAVCLYFLTNNFFKNRRLTKERKADTALMSARTPAELQEIVDQYASTPSEPMALMRLARERFNAGEIDEAEELYSRMLKKHGNHELSLQAELNLIACKEAKDQLDDAILLYGKFAEQHPDSFLAPAAMINKGRCLETLGRFDESRTVYEDIKVNYPDSSWSRQAEVFLKVLLGKLQ